MIKFVPILTLRDKGIAVNVTMCGKCFCLVPNVDGDPVAQDAHRKWHEDTEK